MKSSLKIKSLKWSCSNRSFITGILRFYDNKVYQSDKNKINCIFFNTLKTSKLFKQRVIKIKGKVNNLMKGHEIVLFSSKYWTFLEIVTEFWDSFQLIGKITLFPRQLLDKTFFWIVGFVPCVFFPEIILGNLDPGKNTFKNKSFVVLVGELNNEFI